MSLLLVLMIAAACSPMRPEAETITPAAPAPSDAATDDIEYGRNEDGTFYQGAADAPVTLTDYSDFL